MLAVIISIIVEINKLHVCTSKKMFYDKILTPNMRIFGVATFGKKLSLYKVMKVESS